LSYRPVVPTNSHFPDPECAAEDTMDPEAWRIAATIEPGTELRACIPKVT